jgi:methyl-accepting chemotaxis protein
MNDLLNNLSIKLKLVSISLFILVLMMFSSGYALIALDQVGKELDSIVNKDIPMMKILTEISEHQLEQTRHFERALRYAMFEHQTTGESAGFNKNMAEFNHYDTQIIDELNAAYQLSREDALNARTEQERQEFENIEKALKTIKQGYLSFKQHADKVFNLLTQGELEEAERLAELMEAQEDELASESQALVHEIERFTEKAGSRALEYEHSALSILGIIALLSMAAGISISSGLSGIIVKRIRNSVNALEIIASGNLTSQLEVTGRDEIGRLQQSMVSMQERLRKMISQISDTTIALSTAADEVSTVTSQTNANIQQQQIETDQITTAMAQMSATVREVALNIDHTSTAASEANREAGHGQVMVTSAVEGVHTLGEQVEYNATVISQVEKNSEDINTVLEVIKTIAEQTNLLALNAAIEAARAGEQGRGFAVVADEVRTLAGRTQESTTEINQMIENLQKNAKSAVQAMEESRQQARSVVEQAENADSALNAISESVAQIDQMSTQIATAAEEQSSVTEEMSRNIDRINNMATQNATGSQQTSAAGLELSRMASSLKQLVGEFRI